jgi:hypothetical protein
MPTTISVSTSPSDPRFKTFTLPQQFRFPKRVTRFSSTTKRRERTQNLLLQSTSGKEGCDLIKLVWVLDGFNYGSFGDNLLHIHTTDKRLWKKLEPAVIRALGLVFRLDGIEVERVAEITPAPE